MSIDIEEGTFFAIVGPSGCGKTTMLRILGGLETVTSGEVEIAQPKPGRPQYSMIFQGDSIFPWMTVWDNAAYGLRMRKAPADEIKASVSMWLDRTGLTRFAKLYPHQLSGGMRQRVSIARAFANDPEVLLMDEPFSALDEQNRTILQQELLRIWEVDKKTVLFITHSVDEAVTLADKIMVMTASPGRTKTDHRRRPRTSAQRARTAQRPALRPDRLRHLGAPQGRGRACAGVMRRACNHSINKESDFAFSAQHGGIHIFPGWRACYDASTPENVTSHPQWRLQ